MRKLYFLLVAILCPLSVLGEDFDASLLDSVVKITSKAEDGPSRTGTGFIVATDEGTVYIATASHVVEGDSAPKVYFHSDPYTPYDATIGKTQGSDPKGFAFLIVRDKTVAAKVKALGWSVEPLKRLEEVIVIGFGQGAGDWGVTKGDVANVGADIVINGPIGEGNSGGPILRKNGSVAGMITSARTGRGIGKPAIFVTETFRGWGVPLSIDDGATQEVVVSAGVSVRALQALTAARAQTKRAPPPKQCKLYSWWSEKRKDNFLTSNPAWSGSVGKVRDGYRLYRVEGKVICPDQPQPHGTVPLVSLWNPNRADNFATTDPKWVNGPTKQAGYRRYRREGFVYSSKQPGTIPLVSLWNPNRADNFATTNPKWVNGPTEQAGYRRYRVEGYVLP